MIKYFEINLTIKTNQLKHFKSNKLLQNLFRVNMKHVILKKKTGGGYRLLGERYLYAIYINKKKTVSLAMFEANERIYYITVMRTHRQTTIRIIDAYMIRAHKAQTHTYKARAYTRAFRQ